MVGEDRTSQDGSVFGYELVVSLGFEPITSDFSEVSMLYDIVVADQDDLAGTVVDDIEILEDASLDEESAAPDEIEAAEDV